MGRRYPRTNNGASQFVRNGSKIFTLTYLGFARHFWVMSAMKRIRTEMFAITQADMAEIAGASQAVVSRWERADGRAWPDLQHIRAIRAEALRRGLAWDWSWLEHDEMADVQ